MFDNSQNQIFQYNGSPISFQKGNSVMINATEMAKPFGKNAGHWMRNQSTQEFINELAALRNCKGSDLVQIENGIGCWMHEDVAMEFARWLSPAFAIWCNDRIKELLTIGITATQPTLEQMIHNPDLVIHLATQLKREREEKAILEQQNRLQSSQLKLQAPKVEYVDTVLQSVNTYTSTQMAKELGIRTAEQLHQLLKAKNVMFYQSGQWMLTAKYTEKGYTKTRTTQFTRKDGSVGTNTITVWTESGRAFLHHILNSKAA